MVLSDECHGGNDYDIPHLSKEKLERNGRLPTCIQVSCEALEVLGDMDYGPELTEADEIEFTQTYSDNLDDLLNEEAPEEEAETEVS